MRDLLVLGLEPKLIICPESLLGPGFTASRPKLTFRPVVSGRFDLDFQRSDRRRLVFVRFEGLPFPSYRDAAQPLPAVEAGATLSLEALHV